MSTTLPRLSPARTIAIGACVAALMLTARESKGAARAAKASNACVTAYKNAQKLERSAHLRQAQKLLLKCANASCGSFLQHECTAQFAQVGSDIPSVVPTVIDDGGAPVIDAQMTMDGAVLSSRMDGRAVAIEPGLHEFSFQTSKGVFAIQRIVILQGQRNRPISATLASGNKTAAEPAEADRTSQAEPAATSDEGSPDRHARHVKKLVVADAAATRKGASATASQDTIDDEPPPRLLEATSVSMSKPAGGWGPYLLGATGLAGLGGYALLTYWGRKDNDMLAQCSPACPPASVSHIRTLYWEADVSLGIGLAAIVTSTAWLIIRSGSSKEDRASHERSLALDLRPTSSGAVAIVSRAF